MLELRPTCEHCNAALPPDAANAVICSFECTFCTQCAQAVLRGVCPNCAGNLCPRPVRPRRNHKGDNHLGKYPASQRVVHKPVQPEAHQALLERVAGMAPEQR